MAKMYLDELETASSIYKDNFLSRDIDTSKNVNSMIYDFVSGTKSKLSGSMWDAVRGKMGEFEGIFSNFNSVSDEFCSAIETAIQMLVNVVGEDSEYDYLDDSLLDNLHTQLKDLNAKLETLSQGETTTSKDKDGKETTTTQYDYAAINACKEEIKKTQALITKTEKFRDAYKKALKIVEGAYQSVVAFGSSVDNIQVSDKITFDGGYSV